MKTAKKVLVLMMCLALVNCGAPSDSAVDVSEDDSSDEQSASISAELDTH